jgi:dTDP-4-dehydrorhamnose reductase
MQLYRVKISNIHPLKIVKPILSLKTDFQTILVTGANGQLGCGFRDLAASYPQFHFLFVAKDILAIDDFDSVIDYFNQHKIDYCINCAAYTAVDKAESEKEEAFLVNAQAAANLAKVCRAFNARLIHISTDYVFDGTAGLPFKENNPTNPLGIYGASKLKGEDLVMQNNPEAIIIRTSWVYASFGNNFVKTMLRLMKEKESINVVDDQWGSPTYAADLARAIMHIITHWHITETVPLKIFNYCNTGAITWYRFALEIKNLTQSKCIINPVPTEQFPTIAKRPKYSVLDTTKIRETFNLQIPGWEKSLQVCLKKLNPQISPE